MTTNSKTPVVEDLEDGASVRHDTKFMFDTNDALIVTRIVNGVEFPLTLGIGYSAFGAGNPNGGYIIKTSGGVPGAVLRINRRTPLIQSMSYTASDTFPAKSHEKALDRQMLIAQEMAADVVDLERRSLMVPRDDAIGALPGALIRAGRFLAFDADGEAIAASGTGADGALRYDLATGAGGLLMGYAAPGDSTPQSYAAREDASARRVGDYVKFADISYSSAISRAYYELYRSRTVSGITPEPGLGEIVEGKGVFNLLPLTITSTVGAYSFSWRGQGRAATVYVFSIDREAGVPLDGYRGLMVSDFGMVNVLPPAAGQTTTAFKMSGNGKAGHIANFERLQLGGWTYDFYIDGTTNGDFGRYTQIESGSDILFGNGNNKNAISHIFDQLTVSCPQAIFELGGAGIVEARGGGANIQNAAVRYLEGAGVNGVHPQIVHLKDMKWEYGGTAGATQLVIDAGQCVATPDNGGADTETILSEITFVLGDNPPGTPADSSYDLHRIVNIENGRHRIHAIGGYIRGAIRHLSSFTDTIARSSFTRMRAAPLMRNLLLGGTGKHNLYSWRWNENQANGTRGGQAGMRCVEPHAAILWRHLLDQIVNTGVVQNPFDQGGGVTRYGANFTIDLTLAPVNLPTLMTIEGLFLYVENNANNSNTKIEWFTDATFANLVAPAVTVQGGQRCKIQLVKQDFTITDGRVYVRITKPTVGDNGTIGALGIEYFSHFGNG